MPGSVSKVHLQHAPQPQDPAWGLPAQGMTASPSSSLADDDEHEWIIRTCRKGWDETMGPKPKP